MSEIRITLDGERTAFRPGEVVSGRVSWMLDAVPASLQARLLWFTRGKGDRDFGVHAHETLECAVAGEGPFRLRLPHSPYSFSGRLLSLVWAVEVVALPGTESALVELTMSPTGRAITLVGD